MSKEIIIGLLAVVAATVYIGFYNSKDPINTEYEAFIAKYRRSYQSIEEYEFRREIFKKNLDIINNFNAQNRSWTLGVNQFTDLTDEEFKAYLGYKPGTIRTGKSLGTITGDKEGESNDVDIDYRTFGDKYLRPVKDQGSCGSCWAFAANVGVQAAWVNYQEFKFGKDINAPDLSEQMLVDCDPLCAGCYGGFMNYAYYYYTQVAPRKQTDYKYTAKDEDCRASKYPNVTENLLGWYDIKPGDDEGLRKMLNLSPVPVAIEAENSYFRFYRSGVINGTECGYNLDHGVGLVAEHINKDGTKVWTIMNSWGTGWGEKGYARIARYEIKVDRVNVGVCGINSQNSIPTYMEYYRD